MDYDKRYLVGITVVLVIVVGASALVMMSEDEENNDLNIDDGPPSPPEIENESVDNSTEGTSESETPEDDALNASEANRLLNQ